MRSVIGGATLFTALSSSAISQNQNAVAHHCLAITDVDRRVDCLETGILPEARSTISPQQAPATQPNPSFDCRAAKSPMERAISSDTTLAQRDAVMGRTYLQALRVSKDRQGLLESQRNWLTQRDTACSSVVGTSTWSCILDSTRSRITALGKIVASSSEQIPAPQISNSISSSPTQARSETATENTSTISTTSSYDSQRSAVASNEGSSLIVGLALVIGAFVGLKIVRHVWRRRYLTKKYGPHEAAQIMAREVWQGMTAEQLTESLGRPSDIGREIIRARSKETWKYGQTGKNRFRIASIWKTAL